MFDCKSTRTALSLTSTMHRNVAPAGFAAAHRVEPARLRPWSPGCAQPPRWCRSERRRIAARSACPSRDSSPADVDRPLAGLGVALAEERRHHLLDQPELPVDGVAEQPQVPGLDPEAGEVGDQLGDGQALLVVVEGTPHHQGLDQPEALEEPPPRWPPRPLAAHSSSRVRLAPGQRRAGGAARRPGAAPGPVPWRPAGRGPARAAGVRASRFGLLRAATPRLAARHLGGLHRGRARRQRRRSGRPARRRATRSDGRSSSSSSSSSAS